MISHVNEALAKCCLVLLVCLPLRALGENSEAPEHIDVFGTPLFSDFQTLSRKIRESEVTASPFCDRHPCLPWGVLDRKLSQQTRALAKKFLEHDFFEPLRPCAEIEPTLSARTWDKYSFKENVIEIGFECAYGSYGETALAVRLFMRRDYRISRGWDEWWRSADRHDVTDYHYLVEFYEQKPMDLPEFLNSKEWGGGWPPGRLAPKAR